MSLCKRHKLVVWPTPARLELNNWKPVGPLLMQGLLLFLPCGWDNNVKKINDILGLKVCATICELGIGLG